VLTVADDGKGIGRAPVFGVGLEGARQRVRLLGGRLDVAAGASGGTVVRAEVTLP
jgi:signal transduction histidine kinase